jgi:hypothetical protein
MSWNIFIYAEVKGKNETEWKPLINKCVCDDFKNYSMDFYDDLPYMKVNETSIESLRKISTLGGDYGVRYCDIETFRKHFSGIINKFEIEMKSVYSALGLKSMCIDDEDFWYSEEEDEIDEYEEGDKDEGENKESRKQEYPWVKYMTFPVNKQMFVNLATSFHEYKKASKMLGLCDTLFNVSDHYDDEIRLLFAMM